MIEDLLHNHNLSIHNDGSSTYMHAATGSVSEINLSICSPIFSWMYNEKFMRTCVGAIIIQLRYSMILLILLMQLQVGNFAKQTRTTLRTVPVNT